MINTIDGWNGPNDDRVSYHENCYYCGNCLGGENALHPNPIKSNCMITKSEIEYPEDSVCLVFVSWWTGKGLGHEKDSKCRVISGVLWTPEMFANMHKHYSKVGYD